MWVSCTVHLIEHFWCCNFFFAEFSENMEQKLNSVVPATGLSRTGFNDQDLCVKGGA